MEQTDKAALTRRAFVVTTATGYALAAMPVTAWAVSTPATNLETAEVKIPIGKDMMPAYFAKPKKPGPHPAVVVVHEIFGVHEYIKDVCRRLALEGIAAIAPYLYFRQGDVANIADIKQVIDTVVSKVPQKDVMTDLDATVAWLKSAGGGAKPFGITGFCWGGGVTWLYAKHNPAVRAGVAWYGRLTGDKTPLQPVFPLDIAAALTVPVLGLYGEKDKGIPLTDVEKMRAELAKGKSGSIINVFKGAEHGFHADYRPSYNETAAKDAWAQMLAWFKKHGVT